MNENWRWYVFFKSLSLSNWYSIGAALLHTAQVFGDQNTGFYIYTYNFTGFPITFVFWVCVLFFHVLNWKWTKRSMRMSVCSVHTMAKFIDVHKNASKLVLHTQTHNEFSSCLEQGRSVFFTHRIPIPLYANVQLLFTTNKVDPKTYTCTPAPHSIIIFHFQWFDSISFCNCISMTFRYF